AEDEPLPSFCHNIRWGGAVERLQSQGAPRLHPDITMRLETPVIYFHPPRDARLPLAVDVDVRFRGGWLTQFYPDAKVSADGLRVEVGAFQVDRLSESMIGSLSWHG